MNSPEWEDMLLILGLLVVLGMCYFIKANWDD